MWQHLLRTWAYGKAREHVQKAAMDAVREQSARQQAADENQEERSRDLRCDVVIVVSAPSEIGSLIDQLSAAVSIRGEGFRAIFGELRNRRVVFAYANCFGKPVCEVAATILRAHQPRWVIASGFASGLTDRLRRGQIFVSHRILSDSGECKAIDMKMEESDSQTVIRVGTLLSTQNSFSRIKQKQALAEAFAADAVGRLAFEIAQACQCEKVPMLAIHVVSDTLADDLPDDVRAIIEQQSTAGKLGATTGALWNRFSSVKDLWKLKEDSLLAAETLGTFLGGMLEQLPPAERPHTGLPSSDQ